MKLNPSSIEEGLNAAFQRTRVHFREVTRGRLRELESPLMNVLSEWPIETHPRFVSLFVELWALAEAARLANKEPRLEEEEIRNFLGQTSKYFNSFIHK